MPANANADIDLPDASDLYIEEVQRFIATETLTGKDLLIGQRG